MSLAEGILYVPARHTAATHAQLSLSCYLCLPSKNTSPHCRKDKTLLSLLHAPKQARLHLPEHHSLVGCVFKHRATGCVQLMHHATLQNKHNESMPKQATLLDVDQFPAKGMIRAEGLTWAASLQDSWLDPLVVLVPPHQLLQTRPPHTLLTPQRINEENWCQILNKS